MTSVSFWQDGDDEPCSEIVLVRSCDAELFKLYLDEEAGREVQIAYKLLENGYGHEKLFLDYLALKHLPKDSLTRHGWNSIAIMLWVGAQNSIEHLDVRAYYAFIDRYKKVAPPILRETERFIELLDEIAKSLIFPYTTLSIYDGIECKAWNSLWWRQGSAWTDRLEKLQKRIRLFSGASFVSPLLDKLKQIYQHIQAASLGAENGLLLASVFCFNAARINLRSGNVNVAVLLLHRSMDFFLLSECVTNSLVLQSADGVFRYKDVNFQSEKISILNSLDCLVNNGILIPNEGRNRSLRGFNNARNMLLYTHSVYSVPLGEAESFVELIREQIKLIGGEGSRWQDMLAEFNLYVSLPLTTVFEVEDSFDTFVVKIFQREVVEVNC